MKFVSWNVNGIRTCLKKGFMDYFNEVEADFFCIQESKCQADQVELDLPGYEQYWNYALRKGYSGTAIFTKHKPIHIHYGVGEDQTEDEGRIITLEYDTYYVVTAYTPNSKRDLSRIPYRLEWEDRMRVYLTELNQKKTVIYCGDLNVAHEAIDLKNAKSNIGNSGFTTEERQKMTDLLAAGFVDSFRHLYPTVEEKFTWWSYMSKVRERNIGWRIDYFLVSQNAQAQIEAAEIHHEILGSDHCPILLQMNL